MDYQSKYLKYKSKYENLKKPKLVGGSSSAGESASTSKTFFDLFTEAVNELTVSGPDKINNSLKEFQDWVRFHSTNLQQILSKFNSDGKLIDGLSATAHNDLYKLSMMPIFNAVQNSLNPIVTFGLNLRSE
jgi:hypothetical protein